MGFFSSSGSAVRASRHPAHPRRLVPIVPVLLLLTLLQPPAGVVGPGLLAQAPQQSTEEKRIVEIEIQGNRRVADQRVLSATQLSTGALFTLTDVQRAMKNLWETGLYSDVDILAEEVPGGLKLMIRVEEAPIISKLEFKGSKKVKETDLREAVELRVGGLFSPGKLQQAQNQIIEKYKDSGYYNTHVLPEVKAAEAPGRVEITLQVEEGQKVRVTEVVFEGNEAFPDDKLTGALSTKKKSWLLFWRTGGYEEEKFQKDLTEKLPEFYRKFGYVNAQVLGHELKFRKGSRDVTVQITVDEGQRYYVGDIKVTGNSHFPDEFILSQFTLSEGSVFNEEKFDESMEKVREAYGEEGYIYLQAQPLRTFQDSLINLELAIQEGEPATVRKIVIQGNESTFEGVVRRRIMIMPGDLYRQPLVKASYQNLVNSGFFERDIGIEPRPVGESNEVDLVFKVKEKRTGSANFGAGFGGGYGMTGFLDLTQSNLFGRGKSVQLRFEFGTRMNNIDLSYGDQYFMDTPISLDVGVFNMRRRLRNDPFQDRYKGFYQRWGFPIPEVDYTRFYVGYSLMSIDIRGDSALVAMYTGADINDYPQTSSKVSFTLARDTRLGYQHSKGGTRHSFDAEFSGGPFGGNIGFQKYGIATEWYTPTYKDVAILGLKVNGGTMNPFGGTGSPLLDPREMFIMGGTGYGRDTDIHLRGYEDRRVGVDGRMYARGRAYFLATLEEEIEITEQVHAVLFAEAGNVWSELADMNLSKLRRSAGIGVRVQTPMGPLGLDLGYGFDQTDELGNPLPGKWIPHFRFGMF